MQVQVKKTSICVTGHLVETEFPRVTTSPGVHVPCLQQKFCL